MSTEVVVYEDGKEVERQDLDAAHWLVFTADDYEVSYTQVFPTTGTAQITIKPKR